MINHMRHMGNSGKLAVVSACVALGLLVLTAITLEEAVMFTFLGVVAVGYLASITEVFARRRYLALVAGAVGSSLFVGFGMAFLRMYGLAFNQDTNALGTAVSTQDSDNYFYFSVAAGFGTLLVLFAGAVLPGRRVSAKRPSAGRTASKRPTAGRVPASRTPARSTTQGRTSAAGAASASRATKSRNSAGTTQGRISAGKSATGKAAVGRTTAGRTTAGRVTRR